MKDTGFDGVADVGGPDDGTDDDTDDGCSPIALLGSELEVVIGLH